mgnify:CR=1 FL=1
MRNLFFHLSAASALASSSSAELHSEASCVSRDQYEASARSGRSWSSHAAPSPQCLGWRSSHAPSNTAVATTSSQRARTCAAAASTPAGAAGAPPAALARRPPLVPAPPSPPRQPKVVPPAASSC